MPAWYSKGVEGSSSQAPEPEQEISIEERLKRLEAWGCKVMPPGSLGGGVAIIGTAIPSENQEKKEEKKDVDQESRVTDEEKTDNPFVNPTNTTPTGTERKWTPEEQACIDLAARHNGREWAERHAQFIVDQAHDIGTI